MAKSLLESNTTKAVLGAGIIALPTAQSFTRVLRLVLGEYLPWSEEGDEYLAGFLVTVLVPLISRVLAFLHEPEKMERNL
jgi:hypothetical protein